MNTTQGTIYLIEETRKVSERFRVREFVVEIADNSKYPQLVKFQVTNDLCGLLDNCKSGDLVSLEFNLRGRGRTVKSNTLTLSMCGLWRSSPTVLTPPHLSPMTHSKTSPFKERHHVHNC